MPQLIKFIQETALCGVDPAVDIDESSCAGHLPVSNLCWTIGNLAKSFACTERLIESEFA